MSGLILMVTLVLLVVFYASQLHKVVGYTLIVSSTLVSINSLCHGHLHDQQFMKMSQQYQNYLDVFTADDIFLFLIQSENSVTQTTRSELLKHLDQKYGIEYIPSLYIDRLRES